MDHELISVLVGEDALRSKSPPESDDAALDDLAPGCWKRVAPQSVSQHLAGHDRTGVDHEDLEDHTVAALQAADTVDGHRSKDCDAHAPTVGPRTGPVNAPDTAAIPPWRRADTSSRQNRRSRSRSGTTENRS
jgi:hypothetical protein